MERFTRHKPTSSIESGSSCQLGEMYHKYQPTCTKPIFNCLIFFSKAKNISNQPRSLQMKTGNILWPENTLSDNVDFINRKIMCSYWLLGPQVQYILCNMRTATSVNYVKKRQNRIFWKNLLTHLEDKFVYRKNNFLLFPLRTKQFDQRVLANVSGFIIWAGYFAKGVEF